MTSTDRARRRNKVTPIDVIAGFLGSGKTTLLKRALAHELDRGVKPAVLMNEFWEFSEKVGHLVKETKGTPLSVETTGLADTG